MWSGFPAELCCSSQNQNDLTGISVFVAKCSLLFISDGAGCSIRPTSIVVCVWNTKFFCCKKLGSCHAFQLEVFQISCFKNSGQFFYVCINLSADFASIFFYKLRLFKRFFTINCYWFYSFAGLPVKRIFSVYWSHSVKYKKNALS